MRKIMILGAGIYQVPLILKAKEMGLYVVCVSRPGEYPGFQYADKIYYYDTRDFEKILEAAKDEGISGICTTGTDVALKAVGYVNDEMHLHGVSQASACVCADKALMKDCFEKGGVKTSVHKKVSTLTEAKEWMAAIDCPVILKPVDSSGSRGITKAINEAELEIAFNKAMDATNKDYVVIEEFLEGTEIGVDAFVVNNKIQFIAPHDKINYFNGSTHVPIGHRFPIHADEELLAKIDAETEKVIAALDLNDCAINMDVMISNGEPYILEASGRCGATTIPELISIYYDFDYYKQMIYCALGDEVVFEKKGNIPCVGKIIIPLKTGTIVGQRILKEDPDIQISLDYDLGEPVHKFQVGPDRIGQIVAKGKDVSVEDIVEIIIK